MPKLSLTLATLVWLLSCDTAAVTRVQQTDVVPATAKTTIPYCRIKDNRAGPMGMVPCKWLTKMEVAV